MSQGFSGETSRHIGVLGQRRRKDGEAMDGRGISDFDSIVAEAPGGANEAGRPVGFWTDLNISRLKILWAEGYTATVIAGELGCSRNAVIGKIHRLKLPEPLIKRGPVKDGTYNNQLSPQVRESRRVRQLMRRRRLKEMERQEYIKQQRDAIWLADSKEETRKEFLANGANPHSAAYRKHMSRIPEMTKGELREMLRLAVQNTAAMQ